MSYQVYPVEAVGAYSAYLRYRNDPDETGYLVNALYSQDQWRHAQWAQAYREGLYPIGSTPPDILRGQRPLDARTLPAYPLRFVRLHYRHHSVFAGLPNERSLRWRNLMAFQGMFTTEPQHAWSTSGARALTAMPGKRHVPQVLVARPPLPGKAFQASRSGLTEDGD